MFYFGNEHLLPRGCEPGSFIHNGNSKTSSKILFKTSIKLGPFSSVSNDRVWTEKIGSVKLIKNIYVFPWHLQRGYKIKMFQEMYFYNVEHIFLMVNSSYKSFNGERLNCSTGNMNFCLNCSTGNINFCLWFYLYFLS